MAEELRDTIYTSCILHGVVIRECRGCLMFLLKYLFYVPARQEDGKFSVLKFDGKQQL